MARSFPADVKLQSFFTEQYDREAQARLNYYKDRKQGTLRSAGSEQRRVQGGALINGLPAINPTQFARKMIREDKERIARIAEEAKRFETHEEMKPAPSKLREGLYDGFTKEEKGRYRYLKERKTDIPEKKYHFPLLSSWEYGWKIDEQYQLHRPPHARTRMIQDSFYSRNAVPTLNEPALGFTIEKSKTYIF